MIETTISSLGDPRLSWTKDPETLARIALSVAHIEVSEEIRLAVDEADAQTALQMLVKQWPEKQSTIEQQLYRAVQTTLRFDQTPITPAHADWPTQIDELGLATPLVLWLRGDSSLLTKPHITGIIGSRRATSGAEFLSMQVANSLVELDHTAATSGGYGVAGMATRSTLAALGKPIIVAASGLERAWPVGHEALFARVQEIGLMVSAYAPQTPITETRIFARDSLLAALSRVVVSIEAGAKSESLQVARAAIDLGRPLGAFPGVSAVLPYDNNAGNHSLIRDNAATLVTSVTDIQNLY